MSSSGCELCRTLLQVLEEEPCRRNPSSVTGKLIFAFRRIERASLQNSPQCAGAGALVPEEAARLGQFFLCNRPARRSNSSPSASRSALQLPAHCRLAKEAAISSSCNMALFKRSTAEMDEQIKIELADMRIAHDRNSINAQSGGTIEAHAGRRL